MSKKEENDLYGIHVDHELGKLIVILFACALLGGEPIRQAVYWLMTQVGPTARLISDAGLVTRR